MATSVFNFRSAYFRVIAPLIIVAAGFSILTGWTLHDYNRRMYDQQTYSQLAGVTQALRLNLRKPENPVFTPEYLEKTLGTITTLLLNTPQQGVGVLNLRGKVLFSRGILDARTLQDYEVLVLRENDSTMHTYDAGDDALVVGINQPALGLVFVTYSTQTFNNSAYAAQSWRNTLLTLSLLTLSILIATFILLREELMIPLGRMDKAMNETIRLDQFDRTLPTTATSLEISGLTRSFNTLLYHIRQRDDDLQQHNQHLADEVRARTAELDTAHKRIVQHERLAAVGEFASSIVHELRNPLTAIKLGVDQLAGLSALDDKNRRRAQLAQKELGRLDSMLSGILSFTATRPTKTGQAAISPLLDKLRGTFEALAGQHKVAMAYVGTGGDKTLATDPDKLTQILLNLVKNACEAAPENSQVQLTVHATDTHMAFTVHNDGPPIPDDVKHRLFEPFFTTKKGGTGLGLPTSKRLAEELGGTLAVESDAENGTRVTLALPL